MYQSLGMGSEAGMAMSYEKLKAELQSVGYRLAPQELKLEGQHAEIAETMTGAMGAAMGTPNMMAAFMIFKGKDDKPLYQSQSFGEVFGFARGLLAWEDHKARAKREKA